MKKIVLQNILFLCICVVFGQSPKITQYNSTTSDSSYYDAIVFSDSHIWFLGKHGVITELKNNVFSSISGPFNGNNILSSSKYNSDEIILTGDKGFIYFYNITTKKWRHFLVKGFEKSCFYSVLVLNNNDIIISGGNSRIAKSQKAIPNGFIIRSEDGGVTWKKVYSSPINMVWKLKQDVTTHNIYVNLYHPNRSMILYSSDYGKTWQKSGIRTKGLIHDYEIFDQNNHILVGGSRMGSWNNSFLSVNNIQFNYSNQGFVWSVKNYRNLIFLSCGNSNVAYKKKEENEWKTIKLSEKVNKNIYNTVQTSNNTFYAFGSGKMIYKIDFE